MPRSRSNPCPAVPVTGPNRSGLTALLALAMLGGSFTGGSVARADAVAPINAVLGDVSWVEYTGHPPTAEEARTQDDERHRVHLAYVERKLRAARVEHLPPGPRAQRSRLLDALAVYRRRGQHPEHDRPTRLPRFLDPAGRICAVGYLMEVSAGRALVERVNARWEYALISAISDPELDTWAAKSGFTREELASIQPTGSAFGGELGWSSDRWDDVLLGGGAALLLAGNIALTVAALAVRSPRTREQVAMAQLAVGVLQFFASTAMTTYALGGELADSLIGPVVGSSIGFGVVATFHIGYGGVTLASGL